MADPKPEKPYKFDSIPKPINQTDLTQWELTLWDLVWETEKTENRGFRDDILGDNKLSAEEKSDILDSILLKIGTYGPKSLFIDITKRSTSYKYIWNAVHKVAGFPVPGAKLLQYMTLKNSFDPDKTSFNDHYWAMRDLKISSLMTRDSGVTFNGQRLEEDEEITPSLENQVVADWLESIGGIKLVKFIGLEYSKELETMSLFDLQESMGQQDNMKAIIDKMETEDEARANRAEVRAVRNNFSTRKSNFPARGTYPAGRNFPARGNDRRRQFQDRTCYFCKEIGSDHIKPTT